MSELFSDESPLDRLQESTRKTEELLKRLKGSGSGHQGDVVNIFVNSQQPQEKDSQQAPTDRVREVIKDNNPCAALQASRDRMMVILQRIQRENPLCKGFLQQLSEPELSWTLLQDLEGAFPFLNQLGNETQTLLRSNPFKDFFSLLPYVSDKSDLMLLGGLLKKAMKSGYMSPYDLKKDEVSKPSNNPHYYVMKKIRADLLEVLGVLESDFKITMNSFPVVGKRPGQLTSTMLGYLDAKIPGLIRKDSRKVRAHHLSTVDQHFQEHPPGIQDRYLDVALVNLKNFLAALKRGDFLKAHELRNGIRIKESKHLVFFKRTSTHDIRVIERGSELQSYE